jgi:hypothetical protein
LLLEGFRHIQLRKWIWVLLWGQLAWGIYFQSISLIFTQYYHYTPGQTGLFMTYLAILFAIGVGVVVPAALRNFELISLLLFGFFMAAAAMISGLVFIHSAWVQWLNLVPFVLGQVFIYTVTMTLISNAVDKNAQGWAMGVASAIGSFAWGIAAFVAGSVSYSLYLPFIAALGLFSLSYFLVRRRQ